MSDVPIAEQVKEFVSGLFDQDSPHGMKNWTTLTPTELGILSWHLDNFYCSSLWWIEDPKTERLQESLYRSGVS